MGFKVNENRAGIVMQKENSKAAFCSSHVASVGDLAAIIAARSAPSFVFRTRLLFFLNPNPLAVYFFNLCCQVSRKELGFNAGVI